LCRGWEDKVVGNVVASDLEGLGWTCFVTEVEDSRCGTEIAWRMTVSP
jgi:hypothetical protein